MSDQQGDNSSSTPDLATPVQFLKGVGPQRAELLQRLGLHFARDLLYCLPRSYQDMSRLCKIAELEEGQLVSVCGIVDDIDQRNTGTGRSILGVLISDETQSLRALWFNQPFMRDKFEIGGRVLLSGEPKWNGSRWEITHPRVQPLGEDESNPRGKILPVYPLTEGLKQPQMRRIVQGIVASHLDLIEEVFPDAILQHHQLMPIHAALQEVHQPTDNARLAEARRRLVFQELLVMQLALAMRRHHLVEDQHAPALPTDARIDARILRLFPFPLTDAQRQAIDEIAADMGSDNPMNRLLQGDVGSGKTVVAIYAMLLAVAHGHQAAIMAPTEVLARQHFRTLTQRLAHSHVRLELLTGSLTAAQRRQALDSIQAGEVDLVVGTHAILSESLRFQQLGLVVIDEQHKFGVKQRAALKQAGLAPHYLVMSATPIPRTMSMTLFGDLEVSTLRHAPPGRQTIHTYLGSDEQREQWWDFFRRKLREGRQGYVITPLVEEAQSKELASVEQRFESLTNGELEEFRIDLIHGRMSVAEKEAAMLAFADGRTQVLVATSVLEVGVDVPNATLMTIESGEQFGLAQLHQLRGRISRGTHAGYLCVFAEAETTASRERLEALEQTTDGFAIAEQDFRLRGPGDLLSTKQHGLPPLRIADLIRDINVVEEVRPIAQQIIREDPELSGDGYERLKRQVLVRYGKALDLGDVG